MATKKQWDFKLTEHVQLVGSKEKGTVIGRAHYLDSNPSYYVRYVTARGEFAKGWFDEVDLERGGGPIPADAED